jgi:hypothetical protein
MTKPAEKSQSLALQALIALSTGFYYNKATSSIYVIIRLHF